MDPARALAHFLERVPWYEARERRDDSDGVRELRLKRLTRGSGQEHERLGAAGSIVVDLLWGVGKDVRTMPLIDGLRSGPGFVNRHRPLHDDDDLEAAALVRLVVSARSDRQHPQVFAVRCSRLKLRQIGRLIHQRRILKGMALGNRSNHYQIPDTSPRDSAT